MIKQFRSQLYQELIKMSGSETLKPTSPNTSLVGMTKLYSDMYTQNRFTDLGQEHSDFLQDQPRVVGGHTLQSFTDPGHKQKPNVLERKVWTVQYSGPFPLENQRASPTQVFHNEKN